MKVYRVNITENELKLFSEFLEQREYAKGTYQGLSSISKKNLQKARNHQAASLRIIRRQINDKNLPEIEKIRYRTGALNASHARAGILKDIATKGSYVESYIEKRNPRFNITKQVLQRKINNNSGLNPRKAQKVDKSLTIQTILLPPKK